MSSAKRLFATTSWLLKAATIVCLGVTGLLVLALAALVLAELGTVQLPIPPVNGIGMQDVLRAASLVLFACMLCVALVALALFLAAQIVDTAMRGDPFVAENAKRLNWIGWLLVGLQGVGLLTQIAIGQMPKALSDHLNFGFDVSLSGLFAALLIFVLAQIFKHGSEMRADLEGTV